MYVGNVLVATTVIENGVDMPNVNTIVILQANRFGISTLYQLRGRVGRFLSYYIVCIYACIEIWTTIAIQMRCLHGTTLTCFHQLSLK